jgi:hypothetical protein
VLDQCSPRSLLATEDLVLDDVVLLAIRKQAFRESEKPIRGCQYDLEPSRPFRLTEYCREYHRHCLHVTSLYENVPVSLRASHRYPFSFRIRRYFRLVLITILHVQTDHLSFVSDKGIPKSNTTIQRGERVLRTCPLALENMALVAEFEVSVPDFRLFFKALQSS